MKTKSTSPKALRPSLVRLNISAMVLILVGWCSPSNATITISGVTGVSNVTGINSTTGSGTASASATPSTTQGQVNVYGGLAGPADSTNCTPVDGLPGICNNCTSKDALFDCNEKRIIPTGQITVTFSSSTADGIPAATYFNSASVASAIPIGGQPTSVSKGSTTSVTFQWSAICQYLADKDGTAAGANCTTATTTQPATGIIRIGIIASGSSSPTLGSSDDAAQVTFTVADVQADGNLNSALVTTNGRARHDALNCSKDAAVGVSCFSMYPGDGKAIIRDVVGLNGFPVSSALTFQGIQLFYAKGSFSQPEESFSNDGGHSGILAAGSDATSLSPADVGGLENEKLYRFKVAAVDLAGNVSFYTDTADDAFCSKSTPPNSATDGFCHEAKPGVVYGALGKNPSCFIATAAYGSQMAPQVNTFRQFRNRFLLDNSWGKNFVRFYYKHSPKYAKIIANSDALRTLALVALWPLLAFVSLSLKFGLINALLLILGALAIPISFYVLRQNRGARA